MSSPTGVSNAGVSFKGLSHVDARLGDELLQLSDLAHLLECKDLILLVAIDCQTCRVIASIL